MIHFIRFYSFSILFLHKHHIFFDDDDDDDDELLLLFFLNYYYFFHSFDDGDSKIDSLNNNITQHYTTFQPHRFLHRINIIHRFVWSAENLYKSNVRTRTRTNNDNNGNKTK